MPRNRMTAKTRFFQKAWESPSIGLSASSRNVSYPFNMSFGFAVGDFLAVTKLIVEISESLKDSTGSARQFQHLLLELDNLRHALHEVDKLTADGPPELLTTITAINVTALSCRLPLAQFLEGIRKYEASLGLGCSAGKFKDMNMRVKWALGKQKAVDELRKELCAHVGSINMLLGLYQV